MNSPRVLAVLLFAAASLLTVGCSDSLFNEPTAISQMSDDMDVGLFSAGDGTIIPFGDSLFTGLVYTYGSIKGRRELDIIVSNRSVISQSIALSRQGLQMAIESAKIMIGDGTLTLEDSLGNPYDVDVQVELFHIPFEHPLDSTKYGFIDYHRSNVITYSHAVMYSDTYMSSDQGWASITVEGRQIWMKSVSIDLPRKAEDLCLAIDSWLEFQQCKLLYASFAIMPPVPCITGPCFAMGTLQEMDDCLLTFCPMGYMVAEIVCSLKVDKI